MSPLGLMAVPTASGAPHWVPIFPIPPIRFAWSQMTMSTSSLQL